MKSRVDEHGRAYAGSQRQIQTYVNRRRQELDAAILTALPQLAEGGARLEWVSPLENEKFREYFDSSFLASVGLIELAGELANFWPQRGPQWDALAGIHWPDGRRSGVLLVEAKSYPQEMYSGGCMASESSRPRIMQSLEAARAWVGAGSADWTGPLYQSANRLAHLYFLREVCGVPAWLANVCFCGDPRSPTPPHVWDAALAEARISLGITGSSCPFSVDILLNAADSELFEVAAKTCSQSITVVAPGSRKEWRFLRNEFTGRHLFLAFLNRGGSSSLRYFDCESGFPFGEVRYGRGRTYQDAFANELLATVSVSGPRAVSIDRIPPTELAQMRAHVGFPALDKLPQIPRRASILAGVDEIVDKSLGVANVGTTAPYYRHLKAYRTVVSNRGIDGAALVRDVYAQIVSNWPATLCRSKENWRWQKQLHISERNESPEKRFEKMLAAESSEWYNMIPVASGVLPNEDEGGRRIDLARQCGPGWFEFVELKLGKNCNTLLHAAIEILGYGLIYVFSRKYAQKLGYDPSNVLLSANRISLKVLAPTASYAAGSLAHLETEINRGLRVLIRNECANSFALDFQFEQLLRDVGSSAEPVASLIQFRESVYQQAHSAGTSS
jgi:hypothetical protein